MEQLDRSRDVIFIIRIIMIAPLMSPINWEGGCINDSAFRNPNLYCGALELSHGSGRAEHLGQMGVIALVDKSGNYNKTGRRQYQRGRTSLRSQQSTG